MLILTPPVDSANPPSQPDMAQLLREAEPIKSPERGDVIAGTVSHVDQDGILVNVGHKSEGFIPWREMRSLSDEEIKKLKAGDEVFAYVIRTDTSEEPALLSWDRAQGERGWQKLQRSLDTNATIMGVIQGFNKGGAVVEVEGVQGFVPMSQLAALDRNAGEAGQEDALAQRLGKPVQLKLLELNRRRNRVILSERLAFQQAREENKNRLLQELQEGQVRRGRVSGVSSFGVFVNLGGADGLIHISELSWNQVHSPEEVAQVGEELDVYVLKVDRDARKIALSLRRLQPQPWETAADRYQVGQLVKGTVTKLTTFGAFTRIEGSIEGLIHISELTDRAVHHPKEVLQIGDEVTVKIIRMEPERRRMGLSLKQVEDSWEEKVRSPGDTERPT